MLLLLVLSSNTSVLTIVVFKYYSVNNLLFFSGFVGYAKPSLKFIFVHSLFGPAVQRVCWPV